MVKSKTSRTPLKYICHTSYLYFSDLSLRKTSEHHLLPFVKRNHVSIWNWIQKYKSKKILQKRNKIQEFLEDEKVINSIYDHLI